ncbi:HetP family heterocyst commitment protein [Pleurocapsa sp. PCC 7319]|uniref:HetP family heterocyst commitment protein n=1 Tax=Pleurocapsa sp. PCC 7319 TaxID=118161 RepID=UPI0003469065|nr:HetP family heterocyst commitment protein [Pleurocapsa sp. PCC 7319]
MNQQFSYSNSKLDKAMTTEQFNQVVEAILAGKYSWACVLILRFAGYNPLHYIPYRTYNRLVKDNRPANQSNQTDKRSLVRESSSVQSSRSRPRKNCPQISDLSYLEVVDQQQLAEEVRGSRGNWFYPSYITVGELD